MTFRVATADVFIHPGSANVDLAQVVTLRASEESEKKNARSLALQGGKFTQQSEILNFRVLAPSLGTTCIETAPTGD